MAQAPDEVYTTADVMPVFQDDTTHHALMQWVISNMAYPDEAKKNGIQGRVIVKFVIDENGNVTDPEIAQGADSLLDKAALDLISKCPQWSPGLIDGKPVKVSFSLPINFALQ